MSAVPAPLCSTGCTPARPAASSSFGSRTPTPTAASRSWSRPSRTACSGSVSTGTRSTSSPTGSTVYIRSAAQFLVDRRAGLPLRLLARTHVKARVGENAGYDGHCRDRNVPARDRRLGVVRFRTPDTGVTGFDDLVRGRVEVENKNLEDFVIVRSSGVPMFHVANAYDDLDMGITHVVRGEDLVNTTPRVLLLRAAMGGEGQPVLRPPAADRQRAAQEAVEAAGRRVGRDYAERGYLAEAMRNYLLTLGWGPKDDIEIRPIEELIAQFDLADINQAPAFFDIKKLDHFNGEYIRMLDLEAFIEAVDRRTPARSIPGSTGQAGPVCPGAGQAVSTRCRPVHRVGGRPCAGAGREGLAPRSWARTRCRRCSTS